MNRRGCVVIGSGCAVVMLIVGLAVGFFVYRASMDFKEALENPLPVAKEVLGTESLPPGYYANMGLKIPFLMQLAIISDQPNPDDKQGPDKLKDGLMYFRMGFSGSSDKRELREFIEGNSDDPEFLRKNNININAEELIKRGSLQANGQHFMYMVQRGGFNTKQGMQNRGLMIILLPQCDNDEKVRFAIRFGEDPDPDAVAAELELFGSVADEANLTEFLGHFNFCK